MHDASILYYTLIKHFANALAISKFFGGRPIVICYFFFLPKTNGLPYKYYAPILYLIMNQKNNRNTLFYCKFFFVVFSPLKLRFCMVICTYMYL